MDDFCLIVWLLQRHLSNGCKLRKVERIR